RPDRAVAQREAEAPASGGTVASTVAGEATPATDGASATMGGTASAVAPTGQATVGPKRYFGQKSLRPDRYATDFKSIVDEVLGPLAATRGATLRVDIEIESTAPDGFDEAKVRTVSENAATLKVEESTFEPE